MPVTFDDENEEYTFTDASVEDCYTEIWNVARKLENAPEEWADSITQLAEHLTTEHAHTVGSVIANTINHAAKHGFADFIVSNPSAPTVYGVHLLKSDEQLIEIIRFYTRVSTLFGRHVANSATTVLISRGWDEQSIHERLHEKQRS